MDSPPAPDDYAKQARQAWRSAVKLRKHLTKQLDKLPKDNASGCDISLFEASDSTLQKFRLACVQTIFADFEYATAERVDHVLWTAHIAMNHEYRRALGRLKQLAQSSDKAKSDKNKADKRNGENKKGDKQGAQKSKPDRRHVEKRKFERKYDEFLDVSQAFYKGYIQRLSMRYDIPELKLVAQGVEAMDPNAVDIVHASAHVQSLVVRSCHYTLICLGDLARYRAQLSSNQNPDFTTSLAYYSLAYDLKADSGFAFHQMGIIGLEEKKDLDAVYHFYRAIAVADPHPNATQNLESKFKTLLQPDRSLPRRQTPGQDDAFITWFVKLHAFFYKGEVLSASSELEREVLHRLEMAVKTSDHGELLFKMALINMSAYYVAAQKFTELQSPDASRFCQYALRLNCQYISTICAALESQLMEVTNREGPSDSATGKTTAVIDALLPLLRTYLMWLAARRLEIFGAADALGSVVPEMTNSLARVFSFLCTETYTQENLAPSSYLLQEDIESRGLLPLGPEQVPEACRFYAGEDGRLKPRLSGQHTRLEPFQETLARILDILRSAYFLAEDLSVPLTYRVADGGLGLIFEYQTVPPVGNVSAPPVQAAPATATPSQPISQLAHRSRAASGKKPVTSQARPNGVQNSSSDLVRPQVDVPQAPAPDPAEDTVINMLAPFLKPPTPQPAQQSRFSDESSYGMHTATANEIFGMLPSEPSPTGSIPSGKFQTLPWNWLYTPTPHKGREGSGHAMKDAFDGQPSPGMSSRDASFGVNALEDPFTSPGRALPHPGVSPQAAYNLMGSPHAVAAEDAHRHHLLQSLTSPGTQQRTSAFSQWGQNSTRVPRETAPSSSYMQYPAEGHPASSVVSGFSHPSSLYQGTPLNGAAYGMPGPGQVPMNRRDYGVSQESGPSSATRPFQMNDTTSSYDAAILQSALYGAK